MVAQSISNQTALPSDASRKATLVLNLGRALLKLASPAHRLEAAMEVMAQRLGLTGQFFSTPTALFAALGDGAKQQTFLVRVRPGSPDLGKLSDLSEVMRALAEDRIRPAPADRRIRAIDRIQPRFGGAWRLLAAWLVSFGGTGVLGGGFREMVLGSLLGLLVAMLVVLVDRAYTASQLINPLCAAIATFLAILWCGFDPQTAVMPAVLGGVISLLPGMTLATATRELATGHLVSGSSRMAAAALTFVLLAFGLSIGGYLGLQLIDADPLWYPLSRRNYEILPLAIAAATVGFLMLYRAHWRDWPWILLACVLAYTGAELGRWIQGAYLAPFIGGLVVGMAGNFYARRTWRPASIINLPALVLLVPGSIGLRSLAALLGADVVAGVETAFLAVMTAVALTTGMILASVLVPPKQEL